MRFDRLLMIAAAACATSGLACMQAALAQAPAAPAAAPDPAFEAAKKAFEALPEADRRNLQEALIWTGDYKGIVDGGFGRGTRDAIAAYAKRANLPADGTLDAKARSALVATGAKLRDATGFKVATEPRSGVTIGVPSKFMPKKTDSPSGARFASNDGGATLDVYQTPDTGSELAAMFDKLKADGPGRKVSYRVARPDFFVVSGDASGKSFYTRVARGTAANGGAVLRGYTLSYPAQAKATFDIYSIAIASSFAPFATAAAVATAPGGSGTATGIPVAAPAIRPAPSGTVIVVAPGRALGVLSGSVCNNAQIGGRGAKIVASQQQNGLTLFEVAGLTVPALNFGTPGGKPGPVVVLQQTARSGAAPTAPQTAPATELVVAPGEWLTAEGSAARLLAPLQPGAGGATIFSRNGALIGLAGAQKSAPKLVAGIAPQSTSAAIPGEAINAFLQGASIVAKPEVSASGEKGAADIAAGARASILPLVCTP